MEEQRERERERERPSAVQVGKKARRKIVLQLFIVMGLELLSVLIGFAELLGFF